MTAEEEEIWHRYKMDALMRYMFQLITQAELAAILSQHPETHLQKLRRIRREQKE